MKKILLLLSFFCVKNIFGQTVEVDLFQKAVTSNTSQIGVRVRSTGANLQYIGVTFYILYQSANASPMSTTLNSSGGIDDSRMVTGFNWGSSSRFTNPAQVVNIDPGVAGGQVYDRRYVYGNSDEDPPNNPAILTNSWDTLLYITLNTLQPIYPQGGYAYIQKTSEAAGAALTDLDFANVPFFVNSGDVALGISVTPVLYSSFDVKCTDKGAALNWTTENELNSSHFEIQKSSNGFDWKSISNIASAGNSNSTKKYQYLDLDGGKAFYRIREVSLNGNSDYTNVIPTACSSRLIDVLVYPTPAKDRVTLAINSAITTNTELQILDGNGRIVYKQKATIVNGNNNITIDVHALASGQYILISSDPSLQINKKIIISR